MKDILNFFNRILPVLQALVAGGVIKSSSGVQIAGLISDITAVVQGAQNPSAALIGQVQTLLNDLKVDGLLQGKFIDELDSSMGVFATFVKAIQGAQPGIGPHENLMGVPGSWVFIPDNAAADVKAPFGL